MNTENKETRLIEAVEKGDLATIEQFLDSGLDVNTSNSFGENLLFLACRHGQLKVVEFLLSKKADLLQRNSGKQSIFHAACMGGNLPIVKKLLEIKSISSDNDLKSIFTFGYGFHPKNFSVYEYFLTHDLLTENDIKKLPLSNYSKDPLLLKIVELIFLQYPSLNTDTLFQLFDSFIGSHVTDQQIKAMEYMLNKFPIIKAHFNNSFEKLLFAFKLDEDMEDEFIDSSSETLNNVSIYAVNARNVCLELLLQQGLTMETRNSEGQTLLHRAASFQFDEYEHVSHLRCLIDMGYPINLTNAKNQTPLHVAIQDGMLIHAFYLIYRGADVTLQDSEGKTPLDYANQFCALGYEPNDEQNLQYKENLAQVLKDYGG